MWKWFNYVCSCVPPGQRVLRLNLDETSICLFQGGGRGNVFVSKKRRATQRASRAVRRRCLTHVGVICDQADIQPLLPQVLIGNEATFLQRSMVELRGACPANVTLLRQRSAWSNAELCAMIVQRIGHALAPCRGRYQPVLLLDAARIHITPEVVRACNKAGIWFVLVPAGVTWLLQPLDTHAFQRYKAHLRRKYLEARVDAAGDVLSVGEFLPCVYSAVRMVLQGNRWSGAFDENGFGSQQALVSPRVLAKMEHVGRVDVSSDRPSDEDLAHCFPRRARIPIALIWRPFAVATSACAPSARGAAGARAAEEAPREPRTRAEHRVAAKSASSSSSSSAGPAPVAVAAPRIFGRTRSQTRLLARGA